MLWNVTVCRARGAKKKKPTPLKDVLMTTDLSPRGVHRCLVRGRNGEIFLEIQRPTIAVDWQGLRISGIEEIRTDRFVFQEIWCVVSKTNNEEAKLISPTTEKGKKR